MESYPQREAKDSERGGKTIVFVVTHSSNGLLNIVMIITALSRNSNLPTF